MPVFFLTKNLWKNASLFDTLWRMTWNEIRKTFPKTYVLLKDYHETRRGDTITILDGEVVLQSPDSKELYHQYSARKSKEKIIFGYTGWEKFEIEEKPFIGIRPAHE